MFSRLSRRWPHRLRPTVLRSATWTLFALIRVRRQLAGGFPRPTVPPPPTLPRSAALGVDGVLHRTKASCLEAALIRQRWLESQGDARAVVIGLPTSGFGDTPAHAWIDGMDPVASDEHIELYRINPTSHEGGSRVG